MKHQNILIWSNSVLFASELFSQIEIWLNIILIISFLFSGNHFATNDRAPIFVFSCLRSWILAWSKLRKITVLHVWTAWRQRCNRQKQTLACQVRNLWPVKENYVIKGVIYVKSFQIYPMKAFIFHLLHDFNVLRYRSKSSKEDSISPLLLRLKSCAQAQFFFKYIYFRCSYIVFI